MKKIIIIIIISIFFSMAADADSVHITYVSLVDPNLGFYKVTDSTTHEPAPYVGRVLTINQGDSIVWRNDADPSSPVTIVSEQDLFPDAELKLINDVFSYTFNQAGIYTFYIKEREMAKQTIIVNGVNGVGTSVINPTVTNTPIATPNIVTSPTGVPNITSSANDNGTINESSNIENYTENYTENNTENYTENNTNGSNNSDKNKNSSNLSVISIASIMVAIISILMMFNTRKR